MQFATLLTWTAILLAAGSGAAPAQSCQRNGNIANCLVCPKSGGPSLPVEEAKKGIKQFCHEQVKAKRHVTLKHGISDDYSASNSQYKLKTVVFFLDPHKGTYVFDDYHYCYNALLISVLGVSTILPHPSRPPTVSPDLGTGIC